MKLRLATTMMTATAMMTIVVMASAGLWGCSPRATSNAFDAQVRDWVAVGMAAEEAEAIMRRRFFEVREQRDERGIYLDCTRSRYDAQRDIDTEWRAKLYLDEAERIRTIETSVDSGVVR